MTKITLAGQPWRVHSPSFLQHDTSPLWMAYDGSGWRVAVRGRWGARTLKTRHEAAQLCAEAFHGAVVEFVA